MKIKITFKDKTKKIEIKNMKFTNYKGDKFINITASKTDIKDGCTILSEIQFDGIPVIKYNKELNFMRLQKLHALSDNQPLDWVEIEDLSILNSEGINYNETIDFNQFKLFRIQGVDKEFNYKEYYTLYRYFFNKERENKVTNVLNNRDDISVNIKDYIFNNMFDDYIEHFEEKTDYSGEMEYNATDTFIQKHGGIINAIFVSNKGTRDEITNIVPLLKPQLEKVEEILREYQNGSDDPEEYGLSWPSYIDVLGDYISLKFVDEIIYDYNLYKIIVSPKEKIFLATNMEPTVMENIISSMKTIEQLTYYLKKINYSVAIIDFCNEEELNIHTFSLQNIVLATCEITHKNSIYGVAVTYTDKERVELLLKEAYRCYCNKDIQECIKVLPHYNKRMLENVFYGTFINEWLTAHKIFFNEELEYIPLDTYCFETPDQEENIEDINDWRDARITTYFFKKHNLLEHFKNPYNYKHFIKHYTYDDVATDILTNIDSVFHYTSFV